MLISNGICCLFVTSHNCTSSTHDRNTTRYHITISDTTTLPFWFLSQKRMQAEYPLSYCSTLVIMVTPSISQKHFSIPSIWLITTRRKKGAFWVMNCYQFLPHIHVFITTRLQPVSCTESK